MNLNTAGKRVDIELSNREQVTWCRPRFQRELSCYDHVVERT